MYTNNLGPPVPIAPQLFVEVCCVIFVVSEKRLGLDPIDDGPVDGDGYVKLHVRSLVVTTTTQIVLVLREEKCELLS